MSAAAVDLSRNPADEGKGINRSDTIYSEIDKGRVASCFGVFCQHNPRQDLSLGGVFISA